MKKLKLSIVAVLIVMCAAASVACFGGNGSPKAAFNLMISGMNKGDVKKIAKAVYPAGDELDRFAADDNNAGAYGKGDFKFTAKNFKADINGDNATATVTMAVKGKVGILSIDAKNMELKGVTFHKIDGKWYINFVVFQAALAAALVTAMVQ